MESTLGVFFVLRVMFGFGIIAGICYSLLRGYYILADKIIERQKSK